MTDWRDAPHWKRLAGSDLVVPPARKAVFGPGVAAYNNGVLLSSLTDTPQKKAAAYLKAYKCGWFYKAGSKITSDFAALPWSLSSGDSDANENENALPRPDLSIPFANLDPIEQFMRLMERPNPYQTGRQLRQKTLIRRDFGGAAFWYLEGLGLPTAIYGISPSRMWVSRNPSGVVIGYVMDRDRPGGGVPFDASEIIAFPGVSPDDERDSDIFGVSVVEAVYAEVPLTDLMARHTGDLLTTGGRLAGMMWPKERTLTEDEFTDAQRAWRNVTSDGNAARRMLIFPEPMEWAPGASTPAEIGIPELSALNRDNILTAFPISPYRLGIPMPGGLSSGTLRSEERADYWEGTIHPRVISYDEVINVSLVSRYEAVVGETFVYVTEEPDLDNAAAIIEKTDAFKALVSSGFDAKEALGAVGLDHIKFKELPAMMDPANQAALAEAAANAPKVEPAFPPKSIKQARAENDRDRVLDKVVKNANARLALFFEEQRQRVSAKLQADLSRAGKAKRMDAIKADPPSWWDADREDARLVETMRGIYMEVGRGSLQSVADTLNRIIAGKQVDPIVADLLTFGASRIRDINDRTLQALVVELAEGTRRGYSLNQLIDGVPAEGFKGVTGVTLDNGTAVFGDARAETIARTETMLSYNRASVTGYESFGVTHLLAYDGDEDLECAARDGQEFTIEEAAEIEDHPNGTLVWSPVVDKAMHEPKADPTLDALKIALEALREAKRPDQTINNHGTQPLFRTVLDYDGEGNIIGSHPEPIGE